MSYNAVIRSETGGESFIQITGGEPRKSHPFPSVPCHFAMSLLQICMQFQMEVSVRSRLCFLVSGYLRSHISMKPRVVHLHLFCI